MFINGGWSSDDSPSTAGADAVLAVAVVGVKEKVGAEHGWLSQHPHRRVGGQWAFDDAGFGGEWPLESIQQRRRAVGWRFDSPWDEKIRQASDSEPSWNWSDHN